MWQLVKGLIQYKYTIKNILLAYFPIIVNCLVRVLLFFKGIQLQIKYSKLIDRINQQKLFGNISLMNTKVNFKMILEGIKINHNMHCGMKTLLGAYCTIGHVIIENLNREVHCGFLQYSLVPFQNFFHLFIKLLNILIIVFSHCPSINILICCELMLDSEK